MKKFLCVFGFVGACLFAQASVAVSAGTVGVADNSARAGTIRNTTTSSNLRGNAGLANTYRNYQRDMYYMVNQPDVDTACRDKIYKCLSEYCGDVTVVPGQRASKCQYATESELYNYALLCLQKDNEILLPQYGANTRNGLGGMNTAARLCPSYVQQELISYLSMANMADQLSKSHSDLCLQRRQELEAAISCHSVALTYGNETTSMLESQLNEYCGPGVPGGSVEMVTRFANAGNIGADVWGWAEKIVNLELNKKGADWQASVDAVLATYTNRMNLACGDDMKMNTVSHSSGGSDVSALQTVATLAVNSAFPSVSAPKAEDPYQTWPLWIDITSRSEVYTYKDAHQIVMAALYNPPTTQNAFLNSAQITEIQNAYKRGSKMVVLRDNVRCYMVPVKEMTSQEYGLLSGSLAGCISQ